VTNTTTQSTIVERPVIKVNGAPLADLLELNLMDARVELVSNGASQATLRFYDADFELLGTAFNLGTQITIAFPPPGSTVAVQVFAGEVTGLGADQGPNDLHELVVTVMDLVHRMGRTVEPAVWQNVKAADIIAKIAQKYSLRVKGTPTRNVQFPHLLQTTDDRTFLNELAERIGATWRLDGQELVIDGPATPKITVSWGAELRRFNTRISGAGPLDQVKVRGWDVGAKKSHIGVANNLSTRLSTAGTSAAQRKVAYGLAAKRIVSSRVTESQYEAEALADATRERIDSGLTQARGEVFGDPALKPGVTLEVKGMGTAFSGDYVLTSVEHVYSPSGYVTRFHAGPATRSTLVDLVGGAPQTFHGATIGIVTNNNDDEMKAARVKVKFPMLSDEIESAWARVVTIGGGNKRGLQITPAVNDEVLVIFENGDLRRPIVLGGVWNGRDLPPKPTIESTKSGETKIWHLQTAAGHQLTFDESKSGAESVTILLKDTKTKLYLGVDKVEFWGAGQSLHIKTGLAEMLLKNGDITLTGNNITLKATQAVKLQGSTVEAVAQASAKVSGPMVEVKGSAMVNVEAGGMVALKGMPVKIN
jgi:uncharacterized protein involved in type VI secretion and phage assembly